MTENVRKTGIEFTTTDHLDHRLDGYIVKLRTLGGQIKAFNTGLGAGGASDNRARVAAAREEAKIAVIRQQTESKIAGIRSKEYSKAEVERQREQQSNLKTLQLRDKIGQVSREGAERLRSIEASTAAATARTASVRDRALKSAVMDQARIKNIVDLGNRSAILGGERVTTEMKRQELIQERIDKLKSKPHPLTPDEKIMVGYIEKMQGHRPAPGQMISAAQQIGSSSG